MKKLSAQQLIEFLLIAPFLIIILGIVTEYAYALNIDMTLSQGLKDATANIYASVNPSLDANGIKDQVLTDLTTYLSNNNVPTKAANGLTIDYALVTGDSNVGEVAIFTASYKYIPAFSLPNTYFHILPEEFNFVASTAVPGALIVSNKAYTTNKLGSTDLDMIWAGTSSFSSLDSFNDSKKGIMKDLGSRMCMLFLIPTTAPDSSIPSGSAYILILWSGSAITESSETYTLNTNDGKIYECSSTVCTDTGTAFIEYIKNNGYTNVIFVHDEAVSDYTKQWAYNKTTNDSIPTETADISQSNIDGILKRTLSLFNSTNYSIGNYDNIEVSEYNSDVSIGNTYTVTSFGSIVFVYMDGTDNLDNIKVGTPLNLNSMSFN
jgi:hypothetical protein